LAADWLERNAIPPTREASGMPKTSNASKRLNALFRNAALALCVTLPACNPNSRVCPCSDIIRSNDAEICLTERAGKVLLGPSVKVEQRKSAQVVILSNFFSSAAKEQLTKPGKAGDLYRRRYGAVQEGYYLHRCNYHPELFLGDTWDRAVEEVERVLSQ
jgi:hypothetical protein